MIRLENLTLKYDRQIVIGSLSHTFDDGKFYGITGPSGVGKTTLLNAIAGLIKPNEGKIFTSTEKVAYIFQDARLFPWLTALENVECVCHDKQKAMEILSVLLPEGAQKYPHELSGGMKQRVSIARAIAYDADLLLLDEPFKGLDSETKQTTINTVIEHIKTRTAIIVSHEECDLALCDEVWRTEGVPVASLTQVKSGISSAE